MSKFRAEIVKEWNSAYDVAYAILRNRESARDAAQEATLRALRFEHAFDERVPYDLGS